MYHLTNGPMIEFMGYLFIAIIVMKVVKAFNVAYEREMDKYYESE